ncbi:MAG TPA: hypothetical protein DIW47_15795 [Bacteroidetes bacterium]|nr:hypothetical protein [Bacteroidota bacterium]
MLSGFVFLAQNRKLMANQSEQIAFFERLKRALPPHINFANELSEILGLSSDAIYRRLRGDSALTYPEILKIQQKLNLKQSVLFPTENIDEINFVYARPAYNNDIYSFLEEIAEQMSLDHRSAKLHVSLASDDLPFFMHFLTPGLLQFKLLVFSNSPMPVDGKMEEPGDAMQHLFSTILFRWLEADSDEVWGSAPFDSTLKQIEFSLENNYINKDYAAFLMKELYVLVDIINEWATKGEKNAGPIKGGKIKLYHSEVNVGEMNLILSFGEEVAVYKSNYGYGYLRTEHPRFCKETRQWIDEMESKAILISNSGEKYRTRYITMLKNSLLESERRMGFK